MHYIKYETFSDIDVDKNGFFLGIDVDKNGFRETIFLIISSILFHYLGFAKQFF